MPSGATIPAYDSSSTSGVPTLEDTTLNREVEFSGDIVAEAAQLATPAAAYDYVKNSIELDWYYGSMKGSTEVFREGRGNDVDIAALLIPLLRSQNVPARYVQGTITLPLTRLADLMGLLTSTQSSAAYTPGSGFVLPPETAQLALLGLTDAGVPYVPVTNGGTITAVQLSHVWVEAYVAYSDYRGATATGTEGMQWVPLDLSIPGGPKYVQTPPLVDVLSAIPTTAAALTSQYLTSPGTTDALGFYQAQVQAFLASNYAGAPFNEALRSVQEQPEHLPFLPDTLPYQVDSVTGEFAFVPDSLEQTVEITASDNAGTFLDFTMPSYRFVGHRSIFTYVPATLEDEQLMTQLGGPYQPGATAVQLSAVVRTDGVQQAIASRSLALGTQHEWAVTIQLPSGQTYNVTNEILAGNVVAMGFGGPGNDYVAAAAGTTGQDGQGVELLYEQAASYAMQWTLAEDQISALVGVVPVRPTANVVFVEYQLELQQTAGVPHQLVFEGLEVDADLRTTTPLELIAGRGPALLELSGLQGSVLEGSVLASATQEPVTSTVQLLQTAYGGSVPVLDLTSSNQATELPLLNAKCIDRRRRAERAGAGPRSTHSGDSPDDRRLDRDWVRRPRYRNRGSGVLPVWSHIRWRDREVTEHVVIPVARQRFQLIVAVKHD